MYATFKDVVSGYVAFCSSSRRTAELQAATPAHWPEVEPPEGVELADAELVVGLEEEETMEVVEVGAELAEEELLPPVVPIWSLMLSHLLLG